MAVLGRLFYTSSTTQVTNTVDEEQKTPTEISRTNEQVSIYTNAEGGEGTTTAAFPPAGISLGEDPSQPERLALSNSTPKRFSFKRIPFSRKTPPDSKPALSAVREHDKREHASEAAQKYDKKEKLSKSDLRAKKTALRVRMLITGEPTGAEPSISPVVAKPQLDKIKSQLSEPRTANKLIQELRRLPATSHPEPGQNSSQAPIHAVCLEHTDAEEDKIHFAKLQPPENQDNANGSVGVATTFIFPGIVSAPVDQLSTLLNEMHVIELIKAPDIGLGQPGDGPGLLAGAVPTPETVLRGVTEITPQLMALGFATGRAIMPNHAGIYPPKDRISVLTYWWGLEVLLPAPTIEYLSRVQSVTSAIVNFLSTMALVNNGVREILPFVRYIAQFIDFEFNSIKSQNQGQGVVCAATWIMPAAMVPRPWDFPDPPPPEENETEDPDETESVNPLPSETHRTPNKKRSSSAPSLPKPRPVSSILDLVGKRNSPVLESEGKTPKAATPTPLPLPFVATQA